MRIKVRRGMDLALPGAPRQSVEPARPVRRVALVGPDYAGLKPALEVAEGDRVRLGQTLFTDRREPRLRFTSPGSGRVAAIRRGARRRLSSVEIELGDGDPLAFAAHRRSALSRLGDEIVREQLLASGLWTALRSRPFDRVPAPDDSPHALLVTAIDTSPLAADPAVVVDPRSEAFVDGIAVLSNLSDRLYVCKAAGSGVPHAALPNVETVEFAGRHPAGLPGTHVAHLAPVSESVQTWYVGYQDVIAIGALFTTGVLSTERVVAVGGPGAPRPRLLRTRLGAALDELLDGEARAGTRVISGSVLAGRRASGETAFLGRYATQVSVFDEPVPTTSRPAPATTAMHGRPGGMLPVERFEHVWPFRSPVLPLLRALLVGDADTARALGCLNLAEDDLALCAYVCPAKQDYGAALRSTLAAFEEETSR